MNINKALDKAYEGKSFRDIAEAPISAIQGISTTDAKHLEEAFNIKTVRDLANLKYVRWAQSIVNLAETEE
jgi:hypothetical protein